MKKLRALIIDDEKDAIEHLVSLLSENEKVESVSYSDDLLNIESVVQKYKPHVLFFDVKMKNNIGIDYLKKLRRNHFHLSIVIVSNSLQNYEEILNCQIFYYLTKPVNDAELMSVLNKLIEHEQVAESGDGKIKLPIKNGYIYLKQEEILMLEAEGNYTRIITNIDEVFVSSYNMGRLHKQLHSTVFFRVNRGCIVNSTYLRKVDIKQKTCLVKVNSFEKEISVSNTFITEFNKLHR